MSDENQLKLLFIEDDRIDQLAFQRFLREAQLDYRCRIVASVAEAKAELATAAFDVIVADYRLRDGTAFEILAEAGATPVIFVTGSGSEEIAVRALRAGAADYLVKDPAGRYLQLLPATVETAVRRAAEAEQFQKMTHAVEQSPVGVMILDALGRVEYVNSRYTMLTGYTAGEVLGKEPPFLLCDLEPPELYDSIRQALRERQSWTGEMRNRRKDGTVYWEQLTLSPFHGPDGVTTHFILIREDITERREMEQALRDSRERLHQLQENVPVGIFQTTPDGRFLSVNRTVVEMFGYRSKEELLQVPVRAVYANPDERGDVIGRLNSAGAVENVELLLRRRDGSTFTGLFSARVVLGDDGEPDHYDGMLQDITARKRAEQRIRDQERNFHALAENSHDGIAIVGTDGLILYANRRSRELTGFSARELVGRHFSELVPPESQPELLERFRNRLAGKPEPNEYELELVGRNGERRPVELAAALTVWEGRPAVIFSLRDVSERKRHEAERADREARLRLLVEQMPAVLWTTDCELRFTSSTGSALKQLGLQPGEVVGKPLAEYFGTTDEQHPAIVAHRRALAGEQARYVLEMDGVAFDSVVEPLRDAAGKIIGVIGVAQDITELRQAENARMRLIDELDAFAHTVAHDLKNPLTAVTGFCEFLRWEGSKSVDEQTADCLRQIALNAARMQNIIDELLLLAGVRKAEVKPGIVEMGPIVERAWERLQYLADEHQPQLILPAEWPAAVGYGPWLEEVWTNYLSNAMKYGGRPPRIEVGAEVLAEQVRFWVQDNGPGISKEDQAKLFLPFTRLHQARATGHGLGLSIVRRIMEKLGGEAWVESEPGKGSRFGFSLPRPTTAIAVSCGSLQAGALATGLTK